MTASDWIHLAATVATIVLAVGGSAVALGRYLVKNAASHAVQDTRLTESIDRLNATSAKLTTAIEHMEQRLAQHDTDIALLKQFQVIHTRAETER